MKIHQSTWNNSKSHPTPVDVVDTLCPQNYSSQARSRELFPCFFAQQFANRDAAKRKENLMFLVTWTHIVLAQNRLTSFFKFQWNFFRQNEKRNDAKKIINNLTFLYLSLLPSFAACWEDWFNHSNRRARKTETPVTLILKFLADRFLFLSLFSSESKRQFSHDLPKCLAAKFLPGFLLARSSSSHAEIVNFWFYDFIWFSHSNLTMNREKKKDNF